MDSLTIYEILSKHPITSRYFKGVHPCDLLPSKSEILPVGSIVIANTDDSSKSGMHWVLLNIKAENQRIYLEGII